MTNFNTTDSVDVVGMSHAMVCTPHYSVLVDLAWLADARRLSYQIKDASIYRDDGCETSCILDNVSMDQFLELVKLTADFSDYRMRSDGAPERDAFTVDTAGDTTEQA